MNTVLDKYQKAELKRRYEKYKCICVDRDDESGCTCGNMINFNTECDCGFDFLIADDYIVDKVKYPIITGYCNNEGDVMYGVDEKCPDCNKDYYYMDGN